MIPDIKEINFPKKNGKQYATLTHATPKLDDMGEKNITTQVKIDGEIVPDFSFDWAVEFQGEKYIMPLRIPAGSKDNESLKSQIDLTFQHWAIYQLKRWPFVTIQQIAAGTYLPDEEVATVQLNLKDFCILFGQVLEYYYGDTITIDLNPAWQYKQEATIITISHTKIWNVLIDAFHDKYGVRWEIKPTAENSNTVKGGERYVIRVGYPATEVDHIFEYGFEGGLLKVERQVQSEEIRNVLKGRGGETNIPFRYFKDTDPNNKDFRPDPDWVEELANIYFPNLMPATFRSYVQGWKAAHINQTDADGKKIYAGYKAVGESNAYAPWAYRKGYTDTKFSPVEFVADEITINPATGDKQAEILPGYSPYVKKGSSLDKYGPLPDTLDNNEDIYPTLQGTGMDIAVAVEQIESDNVAESTESDAQVRTLDKEQSAVKKVAKTERAELVIHSRNFTVDPGKTANLDEGTKNIILTKDEKKIVWRSNGKWGPHVERFQVEVENGNVTIEDASLVVVNAATGHEISASGITGGTYYFKLSLTVYNTAEETYNVSVECPEPKLTSATLDENKWRNTFDIWVKNIWNSSKLSTETGAQYSERIWKPVLGDREKNTAKVVFTSGDLAISEDYEFTIVDFPVPDTSKTWQEKNDSGVVIATHTSHWRIKLAKSEAELEATGKYIPNTQRQGKAGDRFVFISTEMTHVPYVVDAEIRLDDWKKDQLGEVKEIKPTAVVTTDRVRLNNEGKPDALINKLRVGNSVRLFDKRFFNEEGKAYETLYLQSITYTYREPSSEDAALNPDVEIVLGNEYTISANPVSMMQGEISALQRQVGAISNVEQIVRAVGDRLYLRKDGISDRSLSPTHFFSLLTSGDFRAGLIGGAGWGFYKDENGNWVLETDRLSVRQDMSVNTLVINQAEGRGGMEIDTAAYIDGVTRVEDTPEGYVCYFDQKGGSVANLFHVDDVAFCNRWTPENADLKFYKRRVTAVSADSITLSKTDVNGTGIPAEGDNIIHFGNYTDATRQYVKVRDVVGGGYERYIENLDSVNAEGVEYFFVGKQAGQSRWFVGNKDLVPYSGDGEGSYIEYINKRFNLNNVSLSVGTTIGDKTIAEYIQLVSPPVEQEDIESFVNNIVDPKIEGLQNQIDGVIETWFSNGVPTLSNYPASSWNTPALKAQHLGDLYYDNNTGTAYRFSQNAQGGYYWNTITDDAITKALAAAQKAQDTANGKRRVFTAQPAPPYDKGDLWVNATYGTQYSNDILRCITAKATGASFSIADWTLASKYTDDTALNNFITGYQTTISDIKTQIDGKAETWYQSTNPAAAWTTAADKAAHKGDLWYCTADIAGTNYKKGTTWYWSGTAWEKQDIPQSVFDTIDGKANIFVSKPTSYHKNDLWFLEGDYTLSGVAYKAGTLVVAKQDSTTWNASHWIKKDRYTDDTLAQTAIDRIAGYEYLKNALLPENPTQIAGGLIMSTLVSLGYTDAASVRHTMAGMNGSWVNTLGGRTIGSWWGGSMIDLFDANDSRIKPVPANAATSLVRMDGSAYFSAGNIGFRADGSGWLGNDLTGIKFGTDGSMTFGSGVSFNVSNVSGLNDTLTSLGNFNIGLSTLLVPCDANDNEIPWTEATQSDGAGGIKAKSIKAKVGLWSPVYLSVLGKNPNAGTSPGGGVDLDAVAEYLTQQGYATQAWVQAQGYLKAADLSAYALAENAYLKNQQNRKSNAHTVASLTAVANSSDSWINNYSFSLVNNNNALNFYVGGAENERQALIQSGHSSNGYAQFLGVLHLNKLGGAVYINNSLALNAANVGTYAVTLDTEQEIPGKKTFTATQTDVNRRLYVNGAFDTFDNYPHFMWHVSNTRWTKAVMDANGHIHFVDGSASSFGSYKSIMALAFVVAGGTSSQFLKADGSVDSNTYLTAHQPLNYINVQDTRDTATNTSWDRMLTAHFKANGAIGLSDGGLFAGLLHLQPWVNASGGSAYELGFTVNGNLWLRSGAIGSAWGAWRKILDTSNYTSVLDSRYFRAAGAIPTAYVDLTNYTSGATGYANYQSGAYQVARRDHNELLVNLAINGGSTSALQFYTSYGDGEALKYRKTIDANRVSGPWRTILTELNIGNYALTPSNYTSTLDGRYVNVSGDTMTGALSIKTDTQPCLKLDSNTAGKEVFMYIYSGGAAKNAVGWDATHGAYIYSSPSAKRLGIKDNGTPHFQGNTLWHAGNDGPGSGLDADLLDGYHETSFVRSWWTANPGYDCNTYSTRPLISFTYRKNAPFMGTFIDVVTGGYGFMLGTVYNSDAPLYYRRHGVSNDGGMGAWQQLARVGDNVASATKLQTARSIWGQSFNGSANVSGSMTGVGSISFLADTTYNIGSASSQAKYIYTGGLYAKTGSNLWLGANNANQVLIDTSGNVGIGTTAPECKLHVVGVIKSSTGMYSDGYMSCLGQNTGSDARLKDIIGDVTLPIEVILNAPAVRFAWNASAGPTMAGKIAVGTIAQYWLEPLPEVVGLLPTDYYGLDYEGLNWVATKSLARYAYDGLTDHERRIFALERRCIALEQDNSRMRAENEQLRNRLNQLERRLAA